MLVLIFHYVPQFGHSHVMVYIAICSLMGSLSVLFLSLWFLDFFSVLYLHPISHFFHECMLIECKGSVLSQNHMMKGLNGKNLFLHYLFHKEPVLMRICPGHECESAGHCYEADTARAKSVNLSPDFGVCNGGAYLRTDANELP